MQIKEKREHLHIHPLASMEWQLENIPAELKLLKQWVPCYNLGETHISRKTEITSPKVPRGGPTQKSSQKLFGEVAKTLIKGQHFGICLNENDGIVVLDVDNLPEDFTHEDLPKIIQDTLDLRPTYSEISPSGRGLHIFYKTDKSLLKHRKAADTGTANFTGSLFIRDQFLTATGHKFHSTSEIAHFEAAILDRVLMIPSKTVVLPTAKQQGPGLSQVNYTMSAVKAWLTRIPPTLSDSPIQPIINRAYAQFTPPIIDPSDYQHWQYIAASVHYACDALGKAHEGATLFDNWSAGADSKYDGADNTIAKYYENSPKYDGNDLTHLTLVKLFHALKPQWPYPVFDKEGKPTGKPEPSNLHNWKELMTFFGLEVEQNEISKNYRLNGFTSTLSSYFRGGKDYETRDGVESDLHFFAQANGFTKVSSSVGNAFAKWWLGNTTKTYNPIKRWLDEAPDYDPAKGSWFQALWETLHLPASELCREDLYRAYLKKNLMGVIRAHYYKGRYGGTTGIVILQGPEKTRKSSWLNQLLPTELSKYIMPSQVSLKAGAVKEMQLEAGVSQILIKDEVESFLKSGDSLLKNFLVQDYDAYRPLFGKDPIKTKRKCIFFGTTNLSELAITDAGSRRIQIIPVDWCDTATQSKIDMALVYKELLYEFKKTPVKDQPSLWVLDDKEQVQTNTINSTERKAEPELDLMVKEAFVYLEEFSIETFLNRVGSLDRTHIQFMSHTSVRKAVAEEHGVAVHMISMPQLKHTLRRLSGQWTSSVGKRLTLGSWTLDSGWCKEVVDSKTRSSGWLMPQTLTAFKFAQLKKEVIE